MGSPDRFAARTIVARARMVAPDAGHAPGGARRTVIVGIDGRSGSGKTTLAEQVAEALGRCPVVHMDDIYPGWDGLAASIPILVRDVLQPVSVGRTARFRRYDWARDAPGAWYSVPPSAALVVEGVGCCARPTIPFIDVPVWIEMAADERRRRAIARDGELFAANWDRWRAQEERLLAGDAPGERAAVVVDGTSPVPPHRPERDGGLRARHIVQ